MMKVNNIPDNWKIEFESKVASQYVREGDTGIIALNYRAKGWDFSYFPIGKKEVGRYFKKEGLEKEEIIALAIKTMRSI